MATNVSTLKERITIERAIKYFKQCNIHYAFNFVEQYYTMTNAVRTSRSNDLHKRARAYSELLRNYFIDLVCIRMRLRYYRPLVTNLYVTKKCNLRCRYCYPPGPEPNLDTAALLTLLGKIRPHNPIINFTGGEPTLHPDLPVLLKKAKELRFYPILLSTNGILVDQITEHLNLIDHLIISLDSLDEKTNDAIMGTSGSTQKIIRNVRQLASLCRQAKVHLSIHSVLAPETIGGIEDIIDFCETQNISLSVSPEHGRFYPHEVLPHYEQYKGLIEQLIELKRRGKPIACSYGYLRTIREFSEHHCYPFISPRVEPDGGVYFPCQRIRDRYIYLQDYENLFKLMQQEASWIADPDCPHRCFLACYVDVQQYIDHPLSLLKEVLMSQWIFGKNK
jgi:MoaA/NifB/PqqE/SkfB family radical SAM enzyme